MDVNDLRFDFRSSFYFLDVDDEYEDEEEQWEDGAEDILEKGKKLFGFIRPRNN